MHHAQDRRLWTAVASLVALLAAYAFTAPADGDDVLRQQQIIDDEARGDRAGPAARPDDSSLNLRLRRRDVSVQAGGRAPVSEQDVRWDPQETAIIVCDMWDDHTCKAAAERVAEMAPAVNRTVAAARKMGVFIIHSPSGRMSFYEGTPPRARALAAPLAKAPVAIQWNQWNAEREGEPLTGIVDGGCSCEVPCPNFSVDEAGIRRWIQGGTIPWTRQIATIAIEAEDAISDNGQEIYNLLEERGIANVILMGVHTNICVCGRPFGLRQMVYFGKNAVLCRDLTDALFQAPGTGIDQFAGTDLIVRHIERHICPTITSTAITGEPPFRFSADTTSER